MSPDLIPYFEPGERVTFHNASGATIEGKRLVSCSGPPQADGNYTFARTGAGAAADGGCLYDCPNGEKGGAICSPGAIVSLTSGAAITAPTDLESDATGRVIPRTTGVKVGRALSSVGAANADVQVRLTL